MASDKKTISRLVKICRLKGLKDVVFSPGSRNAPLVIGFNSDAHFNCLSITDERAAAFFALGMAKRSGTPVIISCTSGTAALNYAPAIAEAYHQHIPLLILTADRPQEWIGHGEGQSMNQNKVYANYTKASYQIIQETEHPDELWYNDRIINEAINTSLADLSGPVHINLPFREPIYDTELSYEPDVKIIETVPNMSVLGLNTIAQLKEIWESSKNKMLITGLLDKEAHLSTAVQKCIDIQGLVVLNEVTSNLDLDKDIATIDRVIDGLGELNEADLEKFRPDLLLSIGTSIVSKKIKALLRKHRPKHHWHISLGDSYPDTFQSLTQCIPLKPIVFFTECNKWASRAHKASEGYLNKWLQLNEGIAEKHDEAAEKIEWSDFKAYEIISQSMADGWNIHMANSTSIRYMLLFHQNRTNAYYANRGVSGIDGCTSTALGYSYASAEKNLLITGDLAFFYDSNAFWNNYINHGLKIILINNNGGGIFRIISGPSSSEHLDTFFEATQKRTAERLAEDYAINYKAVMNEDEFRNELSGFLNNDDERPYILEVFTPRLENDNVLKAYFQHLKS